MNINPKNKKVGFALSGAAARSAFYIGFLERLQERGYPINFLSAQSGAAIVASAFACQTLPQLKTDVFRLDRKMLFSLMNPVKRGGLYGLDIFEDWVRDRYTLGQNFSDLKLPIAFVATDLDAGQPVVLAIGDVAHAVRITCTVPGLHEAVQWGGHSLVDGGLINYMPSAIVRDSGVDVVVGINVFASQHIFPTNQLRLKRIYNFFKQKFQIIRLRPLLGRAGEKLLGRDGLEFFEDSEFYSHRRTPGMFAILGRSMDIALEANEVTKKDTTNFGCDLLIREEVGKFGAKIRLNNFKESYSQGRSAVDKHWSELTKLLE